MSSLPVAELPPSFEADVKSYTPDASVIAEIQRKSIIPLVGPAAVGKSTLMELLETQEPDAFHRVQSFTTRPQRTGEADDEYRFMPHTPATIERLRMQMAGGELVQIAVHPTSKYVYGSEAVDYPAVYNLLDTLSGAVDDLRRLPFGYCQPIALAVNPGDWHEWFMARFKQTQDTQESLKRLAEAEISLTWSLNDRDILWAQNYPYQQALSVKSLREMIRGDRISDKHARLYGLEMLTTIPKLRSAITGGPS